MRKRSGKTRISNYLERAERHFKMLREEKKMPEEDRDSFFEVFLGCSPTSYKSWYKTGIKKIYLVVLNLLDEIEIYRERVRILEKQLNKITKK